MSATGSRGLQLIVGSFVAPLTAGILLLLIASFGNLREGLWALKFSALVGYPAMIVLGLPADLLLRRWRRTRVWWYVLAGLCVGGVVYFVLFSTVIANNFSVAPEIEKSLGPPLALLLVIEMFGALSSSVFWVFTRPDRQ